ncbi:MAG: Hpt domain-containing protein, partial [Deltaproteobacteria bacterium]|nr:Hpt domain-containing protein [Deltaproteobacteria bacterium]
MPNASPKTQLQASVVPRSLVNLLTPVLIRTLCPLLKSEILFGEIEHPDYPTQFPIWCEQPFRGDVTGVLGLGSDKYTLRSVAANIDPKKEMRGADITAAILLFLKNLSRELKNYFWEEELQCVFGSEPAVTENYELQSPADPFVICPVETKFGVLKVLISMSQASYDVVEERFGAGPTDARRIRVFGSQIDSLSTHVKKLEELESRLLLGPHVRAEMRSEIKKLKRLAHHLKSEPLEMLFAPARRLASEIAKQQGKQIQFSTFGTGLPLDKSLLGHLYQPILHVVRNAVDHGIETPSERERVGKRACGQIKCLAGFHSNGLRLIISDDGRGLDAVRIRNRALACGLISQEQAGHTLSSELFTFIFQPGFSTREHADAISGRGLGLDIARKEIESVGGSVRILSSSHHGTSFEVFVPLNEDLSPKKMAPTDHSQASNTAEDERATLLDELADYFDRLTRALSAFENENAISAAYESYRLVHSIKGAVGFLGWNRVAAFAHHYEELLKAISE